MTEFDGWWQGAMLWGNTKGALMVLDRGHIPFLQPEHPGVLAQTYYETVEALGFDPLSGRHENCHLYNPDGCGPSCPLTKGDE